MTQLFETEPDGVEPDRRSRRDRAEAAPRGRARRDPRRRRRGSVLSFLVMVVILGGLGAVFWFLVRPMFAPEPEVVVVATDYPGPGSGEVTVVIPEGATGAEMGLVLKDAGVVLTAEAFTSAFASNAAATGIRPGSYALLQEMKASDAVLALLDPARSLDVSVTIAEGARTDEIYQRVSEILKIPLEDVVAAAHDYAALGLEGPPNTNPDVVDPMEGWFYPTTYTVAPDAELSSLFKQMYDRTISELDALGVAPENRLRVLTIGSITIKEAFFADDFATVARVVENRLAEDSPTQHRLQMDSTYTYWWGMTHPGEDLPADNHNTDLVPYNTRPAGHEGLPPSPIASIDSRVMAAVVNPAEGDWIYFVSTDLCSGVTTFTTDYQEFLTLRLQLQDWMVGYEAGGRACPVPAG